MSVVRFYCSFICLRLFGCQQQSFLFIPFHFVSFRAKFISSSRIQKTLRAFFFFFGNKFNDFLQPNFCCMLLESFRFLFCAGRTFHFFLPLLLILFGSSSHFLFFLVLLLFSFFYTFVFIAGVHWPAANRFKRATLQ